MLHPLERSLQPPLRDWFQQVVDRCNFECLYSVLVMGCRKDDRYLGRSGLRYLDATDARHSDVEQDDVRAEEPGLFQRPAAILGFGNRSDQGDLLQYSDQAATRERFVVDDENFHVSDASPEIGILNLTR
jgi:hypothetical protein